MRRDATIGGALRRQLLSISTAHIAPGLLSASRPIQPHLQRITIASLSSARARCYSSPSAAKRADPRETQLPPTTTRAIINRDAANPPASTRPPPLDLPARDPSASTFSHLFSTAKAVIAFYKAGVRQTWTNYRHVHALPGTRSAHQFAARLRHDISRLPAFAVLLLICGEFTPFVVLLFPSIVPFTCRMPMQATKLLRAAESRRVHAIRDLHAAWPADPVPYAARALGLTPSILERVGMTLPAPLVIGRLQKWLRFLEEDDRLLIKAGGVAALESDEVPLACAERGIPVLDRDEQSLRRALERWLALTSRQDGKAARDTKMMELILADETNWPRV